MSSSKSPVRDRIASIIRRLRCASQPRKDAGQTDEEMGDPDDLMRQKLTRDRFFMAKLAQEAMKQEDVVTYVQQMIDAK